MYGLPPQKLRIMSRTTVSQLALHAAVPDMRAVEPAHVGRIDDGQRWYSVADEVVVTGSRP